MKNLNKGLFHRPVLLNEVLEFLQPKSDDVYLDATAGGGGYIAKILEAGSKVLAVDADIEAIEYLNKRFSKEIKVGQLVVRKGNFVNIDLIAREADFESFAGIIFDLGLSWHQVDKKERGFSFSSETLDMRVDLESKITAEDLVNSLDRRRLYEIFKKFGQERFAWRIADAIVSARRLKPIKSGKELAEIIAKVKPKSRKKIHPATQAFQALRIVVNSELVNLKEGLNKAWNLLKLGGRLIIISYHSLEDGIIRDFVRERKNLVVLTKKPVLPSQAEVKANIRSRSARMRVFEKCQL